MFSSLFVSEMLSEFQQQNKIQGGGGPSVNIDMLESTSARSADFMLCI